MMPIAEYYGRIDEEWLELPKAMLQVPIAAEPYNAAFIRQRDGVQIICSTDKGFLHVSVCGLSSLNPGLDVKSWPVYLSNEAKVILPQFFPGRNFVQGPSDMRNPTTLHFLSYEDEYQSNN